jgi:MFS transporter, FSR family, fosmidomycin resistance protein
MSPTVSAFIDGSWTTPAGGPVGDRIGRNRVIWFSIRGVAHFSLLLPQAGVAATAVLSVIVRLILPRAPSTILVFALKIMPGRVSGKYLGVSFSAGPVGAATALSPNVELKRKGA